MEISVIMPVYKVEKYLRQAIDSVLAQTFKDFELIIVDDGSPDGCPAICDEYAKKDSRIKVIHKENGGSSSARNAGLDIAKGKWIAFIDSDDQYRPEMLMKMWTLGGQDDEIDYVHCSIEMVSNGFPITKEDIEYNTQPFDDIRSLTNEIILSSDCSTCNKLFRADIVNSFKLRFPEGLRFEDFFFYNAFTIIARKVGFISDRLYVYRRRPNANVTQMMGNDVNVSHIFDPIIIWRTLVDFLKRCERLQGQQHVVFQLLMQCISISNLDVPKAVGICAAKGLLSYANLNPRDFTFGEKANLFWWRHGKPGGGSIKYLGGLIKLQLRERKINVRLFGIRIFTVNI